MPIQSQNIGKCTSKTNQELTNISKFTGNISKNTSKFTSKTDQIRLVGGPWGGLPLYKSLLPDCMRREARAVGVCGETYETYETHETYETMMRLGGK